VARWHSLLIGQFGGPSASPQCRDWLQRRPVA